MSSSAFSMAPMACWITPPAACRRTADRRATWASQGRGSFPMSSGASPAIAAETPTPPKDSLYSLHPTRPSSVLILRKSRLRQPPSACSDSTVVIFIASPWLLLDRAEREAGDDVPLRDERDQEHRQRDERGGRGQGAPVDLLVGDHGVDRDGQSARGAAGEDHREEEVVPGEDEGEDGGRHHNRLDQRQGDAPEGGPVGAAVDEGRVLQLRGDVLEERDHHPDDDGQAHDE